MMTPAHPVIVCNEGPPAWTQSAHQPSANEVNKESDSLNTSQPLL